MIYCMVWSFCGTMWKNYCWTALNITSNQHMVANQFTCSHLVDIPKMNRAMIARYLDWTHTNLSKENMITGTKRGSNNSSLSLWIHIPSEILGILDPCHVQSRDPQTKRGPMKKSSIPPCRKEWAPFHLFPVEIIFCLGVDTSNLH